jgi:cytochrome c peroxidase
MHILFLLACSTETQTPAPVPEAPPEPVVEAPAASHDVALREQATTLIGVLPKDAATPDRPIDAKRVALGRQLYFDTRLSKDDTVSCNSCHQLEKYGVDGEPTSPGVGGTRGGRNSPTVYNAALHVAQFWDGRAADVEAQAVGPITNPIEMAMPDEATVIAKLKAIPAYDEAFDDVFGDGGLTYANIGAAIGAFERTLVTPAPFDAWMAGDDDAITAEQKKGFETFVATGCVSCHSGPLVGGAQYQKLGLVNAWDDDDKGREDVTGKETDRQFFKVPSLRNVAKTGPYFHDGSVAELPMAVEKMAHHQLGKELTPEEVQSITAFLESLTAPLDPAMIAPPTQF